MDNHHANNHSSYRISSIEYTNDGYCKVGVIQNPGCSRRQFKLSQHCHQLKWLKRFHHHDLDTIWRLAKQHPRVKLWQRGLTHAFVKGLQLRDMLRSWEEEAKHYLPGSHRDFDDW